MHVEDDEQRPPAGTGNIRVVLVAPSHSGNIGSVARAMKTMGLTDLRIVGRSDCDAALAGANAANAQDVLDNAQYHATLADGLGGAGLVMGLTARQRRRSTPAMTAREAAAMACQEAAQHPVALVFGREHSGLTNDELALCHRTVHIPANPGYPALNLAAAVQVVCYEVFVAAGGPAPGERGQPLASADHLEGFYGHLAALIEQVDYERPEQMPRLMRRIRRLFSRARPEAAELNILRGVLVAVQRHIGRDRDREREREG